jgi:hypothetical protein
MKDEEVSIGCVMPPGDSAANSSARTEEDRLSLLCPGLIAG